MEDVLEPGGSGRVKDSSYSKEPDLSYYPSRKINDRVSKWPTLVLEVGWSETLGRLRIDSRWWLGRSQGQVKIALLLSITRDWPHLVIEKWENGPPTHGHDFRVQGRLSPQKTATVTVTLENNRYVVIGAPLDLSIDDMVMPDVRGILRPIQIQANEFERLALVVWRNQGFLERP